MQYKFESNGKTFDVEYFTKENGVMIRFYDKKNDHTFLSNLVIVTPPYGTLLVQYIGDDIITFIENNFPECKGVAFPYHLDFIYVTNFDEYNGEY